MFEQDRWSIHAAPTLIAAVAWLSHAPSLGLLASLLVWAVGLLFATSGGAQLLAPGDRRLTQLGAFAGILSVPVGLVLLLASGPVAAVGLAGLGLFGGWGAGRMALHLEPHVPGVPRPTPSARLATKVALDEAILGFEQMVGGAGFALDGTVERVIDEIDRTHARFAREGFLEKPDTYHVAPPDLADPEIRRERVGGHDLEILRFESGYAPAEGEPGRKRWLGYDACRDGWAYVLRHPGGPRPWLIATNGYRMGHARIDVSLFSRFFDGEKGPGLNVLIPVLPLHGPRRLGWHSGTGFLGIDVVDTIHAETQALWDMRRLLSWIRSQDAPAVGAFGLSLGGFTTANFASVADDLACAIPGIPLADVARMFARHAAPNQLAYAESIGFDLERATEILGVVSPLSLTPRVPHAGRFLFGGTADRLVTPDQVRDLWRHWEEPEIVWYEGSHLSFQHERAVWSGVDRTLRENGLAV